MLHAATPTLRGEGATLLCPGCGEQHQSVYRFEGLPVLVCPSIETPGEMRMRRAPHARPGSRAYVLLIGPEPEPVTPVATPGAPDAESAVATAAHTTTRRRTA